MLPSFFKDFENEYFKGDEAFLDYYLSWTLRSAQEKYKISNNVINQNVHENSKKILCYILLNLKFESLCNYSEIMFTNVSTQKQFKLEDKRLDVYAEIDVVIRGKIEKHAILFENKLGTGLSPGQLESYVKIIKNHHNAKKKIKLHVHLVTINCASNVDTSLCDKLNKKEKNVDVQTYDYSSIVGATNIKETGNYMFDIFWFEFVMKKG